MKIVVLGATGKTGQLVVNEALSHGHQVIAFVRRTGVIEERKGLTIFLGSIENDTDLISCFSGSDAIISCIGDSMNFRTFKNGSNLQRRTLPKIIAAINETEVSRFILMSSFGIGETAKKASFFVKNFLYIFLAKKLFDDKVIAEESLESCKANWTAIYPVILKEGSALQSTDMVQLDNVSRVPGMPILPFKNVAQTLVSLVTEENHSKQKLLLTTKGGWI